MWPASPGRISVSWRRRAPDEAWAGPCWRPSPSTGPWNLALGVSLVEGASVTLLVAIFASNLPESLVGAVAMSEEQRPASHVLLIWTLCAALLTLAVVLGRVVAGGLSDSVLAVALSFAGGAVLASLADTLMPEAFEHGRPLNAMATAGGFFLSFVLAA
jgi:zinc transporter, ZIP family